MTNGNDIAFPNVVTDAEGNNVDYEKGLTKREYFAAMAMQGYISAGSAGMPPPEKLAEYAAQMADALINELNKQP